MKFLYPSGGDTDFYGYLVSPMIKGVPHGIQDGARWAADNGAFSGLPADCFIEWLGRMIAYRDTCLFAVVPDVVGNAEATAQNFIHYSTYMPGWPLAYVAQDGLNQLPSADYSTLFIGGSITYKMGRTVARLIQQARADRKHIHIGRVNYRKRYNYFALMEGSEEFTCDGTRIRYERNKALRAWRGYMAQLPLHRFIFGGHSDG